MDTLQTLIKRGVVQMKLLNVVNIDPAQVNILALANMGQVQVSLLALDNIDQAHVSPLVIVKGIQKSHRDTQDLLKGRLDLNMESQEAQ